MLRVREARVEAQEHVGRLQVPRLQSLLYNQLRVLLQVHLLWHHEVQLPRLGEAEGPVFEVLPSATHKSSCV